jgi:predicted nucleotidyltransferase component of viral defense system
MIHAKEINAVAAKNKLKGTQIEKDYILSWILFGIAGNELLSKQLVFKGGTVLKKIYFPDYRFSEDLDFTLLEEKITNDELFHAKIDITRSETLEYPVEQRSVFALYSDLPEQSFQLQCYSLSEVLIEKMTALMGRTEPRDLFDFWYLTEHEGMNTRYHKPEFERKAKNKKHDPRLFEEKVLAKEKNLKQSWEKKLTNHVYELPGFDDVFRKAKRHFKLFELFRE